LLVSTEALLTAVSPLHGVIVSRLQVMEVRQVTTGECGRRTRAWLVEEQHRGHDEAIKLMSVAKAWPSMPVMAAALLAGQITVEHARNIAASVRKCPTDIRDVFETELVTAAGAVTRPRWGTSPGSSGPGSEPRRLPRTASNATTTTGGCG
jgi:hypothetical protein